MSEDAVSVQADLTAPRVQHSESAVPSLAEKKDVGVVLSHYEVHNSPASVHVQEVKVCKTTTLKFLSDKSY